MPITVHFFSTLLWVILFVTPCFGQVPQNQFQITISFFDHGTAIAPRRVVFELLGSHGQRVDWDIDASDRNERSFLIDERYRSGRFTLRMEVTLRSGSIISRSMSIDNPGSYSRMNIELSPTSSSPSFDRTPSRSSPQIAPRSASQSPISSPSSIAPRHSVRRKDREVPSRDNMRRSPILPEKGNTHPF